MKNILSVFTFVILVVLLFSGCVDKYAEPGEGMAYDEFRGDQSSLVNLVQYEALSKCFEQINFGHYSEDVINYKINAANEQVYDQVKMLLNTKIIDENISVADEKAVEEGDYQYELQFNVVCGGYYFTDGIFLKKYSSITRIILLSKDMKTGKSFYSDTGYQSYRYYTPDFTEIFKVFIYSLLFVAILLTGYLIINKKTRHKRGKKRGGEKEISKEEKKQVKKPKRKK